MQPRNVCELAKAARGTKLTARRIENCVPIRGCEPRKGQLAQYVIYGLNATLVQQSFQIASVGLQNFGQGKMAPQPVAEIRIAFDDEASTVGGRRPQQLTRDGAGAGPQLDDATGPGEINALQQLAGEPA